MHNAGVVLSINFTAHGHVNNQCTTIVNWNAVFTELALFLLTRISRKLLHAFDNGCDTL